MLQGIFDLLKSIGEFFSNIVNFVIRLVQDLIYVVELMGQVIIKIPDYIGFLPSAVISVFLVALTVIVVYKIIGRD